MVTTNSTASSKLKPARENPLSNFSSYTYNISLYMINPETYNTYSSGGKLNTSEWKLVCRSGGINNSQPRADGFTLDYYIDNLQIVTQITSKETGAATNSFKFHFQVFEPYGFKFPTQLIKAAYSLQQNSKLKRSDDINETIVALQTQFLLVVRFYGYDSKGELIDPKNYPQSDTTKTENDAVFERSWPVQISGFKFKLDNKMITYDINAVSVGEIAAFSKTTGVTKESFEIKGQTVKDILIGNAPGSPKGNIVGLVEQLNSIQLQKQKDKQIEVPDTYNITFAPNSGIADAVMVELNDTQLQNTPNKAVKTDTAVNVRTSQKAPVVEKLVKPLTITDEPILGIIDRVISQSTFVTNAFGIKDKEGNPILPTDKKYNTNSSAISDTLAWYHVNPVVTLGQYDNIRKKNAFNINYVIQRYEIPYVRGIDIGKKSQYPGPYKRYQHYYMGDTQNAKEIIGYEQDYNLLFFNLIAQSSQAPVKNNDNKAPAEPSATQNSGNGKESGWFSKTVGAFKAFLYSPAEQLKARITILGDPDYLITSTNRGLDAAIAKYYGEDGNSINPNTGQVFIEIDFRDAEDYDNITGLLDPSNDGDIMFWKYPASVAKQIHGIAYNVWQVTSTFSKGKFTQELKVSIPPFTDDPTDSISNDSTTTANGSGSKKSTTLDSSGRMSATTDPRSLTTNTNNLIATRTTDTSGRATTASDARLQTTAPVTTPIVYQTTATQAAAAYVNTIGGGRGTVNPPIVAVDDGNTTTKSTPVIVPAGTDPRS